MYQNPFNPNNIFGGNYYNPFNSPTTNKKPVIKHVPGDIDHPPRCINYVADYGGCAYWRILWPEYILNVEGKCVVQTSTAMATDPKYYNNVKAVKVQRQCSPNQREFIKYLKSLSEKMGFRLIYCIDDIPLREDIPDYNKYKSHFVSDEIRQSIQDNMELCGNMVVTNKFMKDYFASKLHSSVNIDIIPNYIPKFWMGQYYNKENIERNYSKHKRKPRIAWCGSGAHFDVDRRVKGRDDFYHINDVVRKTVDDFQWVFHGGISYQLADLVRSGKVIFAPWANLYQYPEAVYNLNANMFIAPLENNNFNKSKSDLKYLEASTLGIPIACQDLCTYEDAPIKFTTGDEMIDQIKNTLANERNYMNHSTIARKHAETRFLENKENISKFYESYMYDINDVNRQYLK